MNTLAFGGEAERAAARFLVQRGYRIRDRNVRCRFGELDIVAELGELLCFVEVRMRSTQLWGDPALTISFRKQRRVVKSALEYLGDHQIRNRMVRFDVISVVGQGTRAALEHIPDAFDAGM